MSSERSVLILILRIVDTLESVSVRPRSPSAVLLFSQQLFFRCILSEFLRALSIYADVFGRMHCRLGHPTTCVRAEVWLRCNQIILLYPYVPFFSCGLAPMAIAQADHVKDLSWRQWRGFLRMPPACVGEGGLGRD